MNTHPPATADLRKALSGLLPFARHTVLSFLLLSTVLTLLSLIHPDEMVSTIRAGILADLLNEWPRGRQALTASIWFLPLPSLAGLLFAPFVSTDNLYLAHLYGLALVVALGAVPLARLLEKARITGSVWVALLLLILPSCLLFTTAWAEAAGCLSILAAALFFDLHPLPQFQALSGAFYGLALLYHPLGLGVALIRTLLAFFRLMTLKSPPQKKGVAFILIVQTLYALSVYLFLAWIIMDWALFPFQALNQDPPAKADPAQVLELEKKLEAEFTGYAPVVSGLWGYLVKDVMQKNGGHHLIDFWAEQIPAWEKRDILLILPGSTNPWLALTDLSRKFPPGQVEAKGALLLSQSQTWRFFLLDRPP